MRKATSYLILLLLLVACFSVATGLQPRCAHWSKRAQSESVLNVLLGDGRRLFANHFFTQADVYFHSGYYPSVFDQGQTPKDSRHMTATEGSSEAEEHERKMDFLKAPKDWIEAFGRHFMITEHTHLEGGNEREILPWLRLSAELDPQRVDTYTVAAYWLRSRLGKPQEAEQFLREGIRNNPNSYELLYDLGRLYNENYHDTTRARDVWELALRRWQEQEAHKPEPDLRGMEEIAVNLAHVEEQAKHYPQAITYLELASKASPHPEPLVQQIAALKQKAATASR